MRKRQKLLPGLSDVTVLVLLARFALVLGQTTCNNGQGRVLYERLPNQQLQGFDDDVVRDSAPPFRVLEKCQDLCLRDRTASNNLGRACTSFDFQPGSRIASFSGSVEYEESTCYLTREQAAPEGIGNLMLVPNSVHFTEVCITSSRPDRECPSRRYVFERHPRKKLKLPVSDIKEVTAANRSDCEDKCLNEFSFVCRSANYDSTLRSCAMSRFTRRTHPELLEDDPNSDYLENTCLNAERRCDGLIVYVKEENKRLGGPFEVEIFNNMTLEECQSLCLRAEKYFCRSIEFDDQTKQCILSEEDSVSQKDDLSISSSPTHHFYDLVCLDNQRGAEYPDNSVTSHLFASGRRPDTAFQRYRNSRLGGEFHSEITGRSLSECLDECLRQTSFQCRSAVYSDRFRTCRLSRYNQRDGMRIIYDADYDYYENLMPHLVGGDTDTTNGRPDPTDWRPPYGGDRDRDRVPDDRIPPGRYPQGDRYPMGSRPDYGAGYDPYMGGYEPQRGYVDDRYGGYYPSGGGRLPPPLPPPMPAFPDRDRGYRRPAVGMAPDGGGYPFEIPYGPSGTGYDNTLGGGDGFGGYGPQRPYETRCDNTDTFKQVAAKRKMRKQYIRRVINAPSLGICQQECAGARDFMCRSFNYRDSAPYETEGNCELSDRDSRDLEVPSTQMFESDSADYYERTPGRGGPHDECLDVGQVCNEDGMEFTLRTPEGFVGRIYAYGFYDRCFFRGNGGTVNVLRISGPQGYPECGTQRYGDTMTNIIVVQFSDNVQTGRDKRFNLTCMFRGPGEAVVTSGYIGAGFQSIDRSGSPIPIEYLPAENSMSNKVRLMILYQGRPTTTIAVGDPLTFRLESQDGYSHATDIFATNVVARDPYSGRSVQLIDNYGCPVDSLVFPELGRSRDNDALEARFNAFKIPESNFLVFEATVRTCRGGCQPAYCPGPSGRSEPSFGRRKRSLENGTETIGTAEPLVAANPDPADDDDDEVSIVNGTMVNENATSAKTRDAIGDTITAEADTTSPTEMPEQVREMIESRYFRPLQVFQSREEMQQDTVARKMVAPIESVCLTHAEYYGLISAVILLIILLISITFAAGIVYRSYWKVFIKNRTLDRSSPVNSFSPSALHNAGGSQFEASGRAHSTASRGGGAGTPHVRTPGVSLFGSGLQKTFATGNLSRMCQIPVMNPLSRAGAPKSEFDDPSEPIYTDPSLFERSRSLRSIAVDQTEDANNV
ncbi:uncharacterized protein LOC120896418 isoform X7 [Anopheles arabiensis]|uniref:uncharacterized protein LOC120896418 isoform X7 n=1 Tax=Anopheles arabiensis TaxID=7173 RepID=UPI001AACD64B|nr:uncharacterized protein LOC120896418 isoform X7 [Anopheles arabiensis]